MKKLLTLTLAVMFTLSSFAADATSDGSMSAEAIEQAKEALYQQCRLDVKSAASVNTRAVKKFLETHQTVDKQSYLDILYQLRDGKGYAGYKDVVKLERQAQGHAYNAMNVCAATGGKFDIAIAEAGLYSAQTYLNKVATSLAAFKKAFTHYIETSHNPAVNARGDKATADEQFGGICFKQLIQKVRGAMHSVEEYLNSNFAADGRSYKVIYEKDNESGNLLFRSHTAKFVRLITQSVNACADNSGSFDGDAGIVLQSFIVEIGKLPSLMDDYIMNHYNPKVMSI